MLNHLEGEFTRIGKPGMAKIAAGMLEELKIQGIKDIPFPSVTTQNLQNNLVENNPPEIASQTDLPPFVFQIPEKNASGNIFEIDFLYINVGLRNILIKAGKTQIRDLYETSDFELREIRLIGRVRLRKLREELAHFRDMIIEERKRHNIGDNSPVTLPFPTKARSGYFDSTRVWG